MGTLVFILGDLPPKSAPVRGREFEDFALHPLLSLLELHEELLLSIALPGPLISLLRKETITHLRRCVDASRIELVHILVSDPSPVLLIDGSLPNHLEHSIKTWTAVGLPPVQTLWSSEGWLPGFEDTLPSLGITTVVTPLSRIRSDLKVSEGAPSGIFVRSVSGIAKPLTVVAIPDPVPLEKLHSETGSEKDLDRAAGANNDFTCHTLLVSDKHLFAHSAPAARQALQNFLRARKVGEGSGVLPIGALSEPKHFAIAGGGAPVRPEAIFPPPVKPQLSHRLRYFEHRIGELASAIDGLPAKIDSQPNALANQTRFTAAEASFLEAQHRGIISGPVGETANEPPGAMYEPRRFTADRIIRAQVEVDAIEHPEIDPLVGWIHTLGTNRDNTSANPYVALETPFLRLAFLPEDSGRIIGWEYKPRKHDFVNTFSASGCDRCGVELLLEPSQSGGVAASPPNSTDSTPHPLLTLLSSALENFPQRMSEVALSRRSLDLAALRISSPLGSWSENGPRERTTHTLVKQYLVHAGVGAHLQNATTGFSCEYWIEGAAAPSASQQLCTVFSVIMPYGAPETTSLRCLTAFGGTSDRTLPIHQARHLGVSDVEGGLHGLRVIDGVETLVLDIRSAKPLTGCVILPLPEPGEKNGANGLILGLLQPASRLFQDHRSNTIFVSIC